MTWGEIRTQAAALPVQRALDRFGVERLWAAIGDTHDLRRCMKWACALAVVQQYPFPAAAAPLTKLQPVLRWLGIKHGGGDKDVVVPAEFPKMRRTDVFGVPVGWKVEQ